MKSRNVFTNTEGMPKIAFRSDIAEEEKNAGPSPAEIRQRAFEIHIEPRRDSRLRPGRLATGRPRAPGKVQEQRERNKKELRYVVKTIFSETRRRSAILKPPSIVGWYRILRTHYHWTVFQAIRYALWLAR